MTDIDKRRFLVNSLSSAGQCIGTSVIVFVLYKYLLVSLGAELLGVWSLVLAVSSITEIGKLGLAGSVVKYVAKHGASGDWDRASKVIETSLVSVAFFAGVLLCVVYPVGKIGLKFIIYEEHFKLAQEILPYTCISLWLMVLSGVLMSALDGIQLIFLRNMLIVGGALVHLILCFVMVPKFGLTGVAYSRVTQQALVLVAAWLLVKKAVPNISMFPIRWKRDIFKEVAVYGVNFQLIVILRMFYDPITKWLLGHFGGLSMVGYYEMASRLVTQARQVIVSANQAIVPVVADLVEKNSKKIDALYRRNYVLFMFVSLGVYTALIVTTPIISKVWIGSIKQQFTLFLMLLSLGWLLNSANVPAFFAFVGTGQLRYNVLSSLLIAVGNLGVGFWLGSLFGGIGVVLGWVISLSVGSSIIYLGYHRHHGIPLVELWPTEIRRLSAACLVLIIISIWVEFGMADMLDSSQVRMMISGTGMVIVIFLFWSNELRGQITTDVFGLLRRRAV